MTPSKMPAAVRHARIMEAFNRDGFVSVSDLARRIGVSAMTIRRDLMMLDARGLIVRTHGGALSPSMAEGAFDAEEPLFDQRMARNAAAKAAIARSAAGLVGFGEAVGLDVGTSVLALADELRMREDLRIFTGSLRAATQLADSANAIYILGGQVRVPEFSVVGTSALRQLENHVLDHVFIGVSGLSEGGFFDYSPEDSEVKRAFIGCAESVVVLCDASKFGRRALARVGGLEEIDVLITDAAPAGELAAALTEASVKIVVADRRELTQ
jgi:DeoR family glycerol-3-phosphate regulon repressor